jgi:nitroimidazol reductase NimA-like FMN-containing flavoprotein (pyridoxamine 5'-phosphate oxidase superfamily)
MANDREISSLDEIETIIRSAQVCRLAMADEAGNPYIVPLCFGYENRTLYFHTGKKGKKLDILKKNNKVCVEFDIVYDVKKGETPCKWGMKFKSVIGFGNASLIEDPESKRRALDMIMRQYSEDSSFEYPEPALNSTVIIKVDIRNLTGKQAR